MIQGQRFVVAAVGVLLAASATLATETILVRSGNGSGSGVFDSLISRMEGPADSGFPNVFTASDFHIARIGNPACIVVRNGAWTPFLSTDLDAMWIGTDFAASNEGSTALYAVEFMVATAQVGQSNLLLSFAVDNVLGSGPNAGVYINEVPLANSNGGNFNGTYQFNLDVTGLLVPGSNWLYINAVDLGGPAGLMFSATFTVEPGASAGTEDQPEGFALDANWPNPFNPVTTIGFSLPETSAARLDVYNLAGTRVATLVDGLTAAGAHQVSFDAANLASGVYFYTLQAAGLSETRKMILQK